MKLGVTCGVWMALCACGPVAGALADTEGEGGTDSDTSTSSLPDPSSSVGSTSGGPAPDATGGSTSTSTSTGAGEPYLCLPFETVELPDLNGFRRWVDLNGDGSTSVIAFDDVPMPTSPTTYVVQLQHEDGRVIELPGRHARFGDIDGDGVTDAMVVPSSGLGVWVRGHAWEDWFENESRDIALDDAIEPELWDAALHHVNDDAFADLVKHPDEGYVQVRLGRGDGTFEPAVEVPEATEHGHIVASTPGRVLVWEEAPRYAWTGRYTELRFGLDLAEPVAISTDLITTTFASRGDFDGDGDIDVVVKVDGVVTLLQMDDDAWTLHPMLPSTEFAAGSFDSDPGADLLVLEGGELSLLRGFALDPEGEPDPVVYVPAPEFPDATLWLTDAVVPIVGDGLDSIVRGYGFSPTVWTHARLQLCE